MWLRVVTVEGATFKDAYGYENTVAMNVSTVTPRWNLSTDVLDFYREDTEIACESTSNSGVPCQNNCSSTDR